MLFIQWCNTKGKSNCNYSIKIAVSDASYARATPPQCHFFYLRLSVQETQIPNTLLPITISFLLPQVILMRLQ